MKMLIKAALLLVLLQLANALTFNTTILRRESYSRKLIRESEFFKSQESNSLNCIIYGAYNPAEKTFAERYDEFRILRRVKQSVHYLQGYNSKYARQPFYDYGDTEYLVVDKGCKESAASCPDFCNNPAICKFLCDLSCCPSENEKTTNIHGPCDNKAKFDQTISTSYEKDGRKLHIEYDTGSSDGFLGVDVVGLGSKRATNKLKVPKTIFGQAQKLAPFFTDMLFDGILGLAFRSISEDDVQPVFQHAVELKLVEKPIFTVWLKRDGAQAKEEIGGQITYGGFDDQHCSPNVNYIPIISKTYWHFVTDGTGVNGVKNAKKGVAVSDTGTSLIVGPNAPLNKLVNATSAVYNSTIGFYTLPCKTKFTWSVWAQNIEYPISSDNLLIQIEPGVCVLGYDSSDSELGDFDYILGYPFIREYCQVYEVAEGKIGLSKASKK